MEETSVESQATQPTTIDLIAHALESNPTKVSDTFNDLIMTRVADAVQARKQELSNAMFDDGQEDDGEEIDDSDEQEDEEDSEQSDNDEAEEDENTETDA